MANFVTTDAETIRSLAKDLVNGKRGDLDAISEGVSLLLRHQADIVEKGFVTPGECASTHEVMTDTIRGLISDASLQLSLKGVISSAGKWGSIAVMFIYGLRTLARAKGWL
jgi:hypothetical protein